MPSPTRVLDSHIHLWPSTSANASGHSWMEAGGPLTRQFSIEDYIAANRADPAVLGFVYVETDRRLDPFIAQDQDFSWANETFEEVKWLRRIVEGTPGDGEGFRKEHGDMMKGAIVWAPVNHGVEVFKSYVKLARQVAGEETWKRVKGFRYLVQGILDQQKFKDLVLSEGFADVMEEIGEMGLSFDVGVDTHRGGPWQLEIATEAIETLRTRPSQATKKTVFIINHLSKPDCTRSPPTSEKEREDHQRWCQCIERLSKDDKVYMKLSGAFSEMQQQDASKPRSATENVKIMKPWLDHLFRTFTPEKIMFGSDWPVCNVGGPGNDLSWSSWKATTQQIQDAHGLSEEQRDAIWYRTAAEAYNLS